MTDIKPPSRGDQTRQALIQAALEVFGRAGFDAASTRAIAESAGVNQALIGYHFGGKQGLYIGVFEHIVGEMQQHMAPVAATVMEHLATAPATPDERRDLALQLMVTVADAFNDMIAEHMADGWVRLILREQQDPTAAFDLLYDNVIARMLGLATHLVAMATGLEEGSEACRIRALMLFGQVLVFHAARGSTSRLMAWETTLGPHQMAAIKEQFRLVLDAQFAPGGAVP